MADRNDLTSLVMLLMVFIWIGIAEWPGWTERGSASFCGLMLITFLLLSWRKDSRWPSESRLDPEKIDLKFSQPWIVLRLSAFFQFLPRLLRKPSPYFRRMVLSKEGGLEFHYIEPLNGIDVVDHLELGQVSSAHYWKEADTMHDHETGGQRVIKTTHFAIKAGSVIHEIPNPPSSFWRDVPKKIERLCKILKLNLRKSKPRGTKFYDIYTKSVKEPENNDGDHDPISKDNWIRPDGTESGPGVPEDWYLTYDGPSPVVEGIYDLNYAVDRGNGAVPIEFYIKKWGVPEGFGGTEHEKLWWMED
mgnify:FL=1